MECEICLEDYNQVERVPKMVPCGHTVCLQCLQRSDRKECPTCRWVFDVPPDALPNNFALLRLIVHPDSVLLDRPSRCWCSDCRAAAAPRCWGEDHEVLPEKRALRRHLHGALQKAAGQLEHLQDQCQGEQAVQALTLLTAESCSLNLKAGSHELTGNVENTEDPLTQLMWLLVATKAGLIKARPGRQVDATAVSPTDADTRKNCRENLLAELPGVTRLVGVWCDEEPDWSLQVLNFAAPTVERLGLCRAREAHLRAAHAMPRLRRLHVWGDEALAANPLQLPAHPPGHAGLQWLRVGNLPRVTTQSLLRAHGGTLEELELEVGSAGSYEQWPRSCGDLHSLLQDSRLRALRRLVLRGYCKAAECSQQRAEVRRVLPGAEVLCGECDKVEDESGLGERGDWLHDLPTPTVIVSDRNVRREAYYKVLKGK